SFNLGIRNVKEGANSVSIRRVRPFLERELQNLDHEAVLSQYEQSRVLPRLNFAYGDWQIEFDVIPKRRGAARQIESRPVGLYPPHARWGECDGSLRRVLSAKAKRYGRVAQPYLIAVNALSPWGVDKNDYRSALFGIM